MITELSFLLRGIESSGASDAPSSELDLPSPTLLAEPEAGVGDGRRCPLRGTLRLSSGRSHLRCPALNRTCSAAALAQGKGGTLDSHPLDSSMTLEPHCFCRVTFIVSPASISKMSAKNQRKIS